MSNEVLVAGGEIVSVRCEGVGARALQPRSQQAERLAVVLDPAPRLKVYPYLSSLIALLYTSTFPSLPTSPPDPPYTYFVA